MKDLAYLAKSNLGQLGCVGEVGLRVGLSSTRSTILGGPQ